MECHKHEKFVHKETEENPFISDLKELVSDLREIEKSTESLIAQRDDLFSKLVRLKEKIDSSQVVITDEDGLIHHFTGYKAGTRIALIVLKDE